MGLSLTEYLIIDDLTVLLGLIGALLFLLHNLYKPQPLVHPILLGRQSDVARVRNPGESAVYRNYGTGLMGRFPLRPAKDIHILADLIKQDSDALRTLWSTKITNPQLQDHVASVGTGLLRLAGLQPQESSVLLLLNDGIEFLISDLALASHSILSFTIASSDLLSSVLESHSPSAIITHADLLHEILEIIYDSGKGGQHTIIVVGEPSSQALASVASLIKVIKFSDVEREGIRVEKILSPPPKSSDVFTVSFFASETGQLQGAQLTHENITAGVTAIRALLPLSHAISSLDTIVSAHSLSTAYGRATAYSAVFEGTNFATLESSKVFRVDEATLKADITDLLSIKLYPIPSPTILFIKPGHLDSLASCILKEAQKSFLTFQFAWRHKLAGISEGFITKDSLWDRLLFDNVKTKIFGDGAVALRALIVSGGPIDASSMTSARIAFSVPIVNSFTHPLVAGPVLASHPLDLQDFPLTTPDALATPMAHVGPPSINIEAKLVGVDDELVEKGADPVGVFLLRGPAVGTLLGIEDYVAIPGSDEEDGWVGTGTRAKVQPNGSFKMLTR